jgi:Na+-transporting methylmalonyl-CoA/oxaloacetate decarboxylase gamma subunit
VNPIIQGLLITAIGMGLVFVAILLLWGLMVVIVRITAENNTAKKRIISEIENGVETSNSPLEDSKKLQKVAAVAVAIAMSLQKTFPVIRPQESNSISPWQATRRNQVFGKPDALLNRKSRGKTK